MGQIRYDCPHPACRTRGAAFETFSQIVTQLDENPLDSEWAMFAQCTQCRRGVIFRLFSKSMHVTAVPSLYIGDEFYEFWHVQRTDPEEPVLMQIAEVPPQISAALSEAEKAFDARIWSAASVMYGKVIERTLRDIDPEAKGMLNQRIRKLEDEKTFPHALIELLDRIKFLRNDGAHDDIDPDEVDVRRGREFVRLFLTYVYELPNQIADAKEERFVKRARFV